MVMCRWPAEKKRGRWDNDLVGPSWAAIPCARIYSWGSNYEVIVGRRSVTGPNISKDGAEVSMLGLAIVMGADRRGGGLSKELEWVNRFCHDARAFGMKLLLIIGYLCLLPWSCGLCGSTKTQGLISLTTTVSKIRSFYSNSTSKFVYRLACALLSTSPFTS